MSTTTNHVRIVPLTHDEVEALDCAMTAGLTPHPNTVTRMLATIKHLQRELRQQGERWAEAAPRIDNYHCDECGQLIEGACYDHAPSCSAFPSPDLEEAL